MDCNDEKLICDVCGQEAIGVVASRLGPISFAKCKRCFENGLEPYWLVVATIVMIGGLDNAAEWLKELVKITLEFKGITMEKFIDDVQELIDASKGGQHDV